MTFNPAVWRPIAIVLSVLNLVGVWMYAGDPLHASAHAVVALGFALWAQRLRPASGKTELPPERLESLEAELSRLRQELVETQERLDFTERMLAQGSEKRRVGPQE
jgi:hypothetical protein